MRSLIFGLLSAAFDAHRSAGGLPTPAIQFPESEPSQPGVDTYTSYRTEHAATALQWVREVVSRAPQFVDVQSAYNYVSATAERQLGRQLHPDEDALLTGALAEVNRDTMRLSLPVRRHTAQVA